MVGCSGGGGGGGDNAANNPGPVISSSVTGHVADARSGDALAGVTVQAGTSTALSDANGNYSLAAVAPAANVVVRFSKAGYAANFATVDVAAGRASVADRRLAMVAVRKEVNADAGGSVTLDASPALMQLAAGSLVNAATGTAATGPVTVEMTPVDPGIDPLNMPGNYRVEGEPDTIESMGALQVEIRDAAGAMLNLAPGKTALIRIPVPAGATSAPLTMPLYYFREASGLWVREGVAALAGTAPHQYYEGVVSHFTVWNADKPLDTIYINGCVVNAQLQPVDATVTSTGVDYYGAASIQTVMPGGQFKVAARRNSRVLVGVRSGNDNDEVEAVTGSGDLTLPACLSLANKPPAIVAEPIDLALAPGAFGQLDVVAVRAAQFQWYRNGQPTGSRTRTLVIAGDTGAQGDYHVVVSNEFGSATSRTVKVTMGMAAAAPAIVSQPADLNVLEGADASFLVAVHGDSLSYQWLRNGLEIPGANGAVLTLGAAALSDTGAQFKCRVSNSAGSILSGTANLTVSSQAVVPAFVQQPANIAVPAGQRATFAVVASGTAPFTYQWLREGAAIDNATGASYQTPATALADSGVRYSVRVGNQKGSATSTQAVLTVTAASGVPGAYLPMLVDSLDANGKHPYGAVPAAGGKAVSLLAPGQGMVISTFVQGRSANASSSTPHVRSMLVEQNQRLYRQDLVGTGALPAAVPVSSLATTSVCGIDPDDGIESGWASMGADYADAGKSWIVMSKAGADGACSTVDDTFVAVRMNMAGNETPLAVPRPLAALHAADGALSGWLVRQGQQMQRVDLAFANPVTLFTLPAADLGASEEPDGFPFNRNQWTFVSGSKVYSVDLSGSPAAPMLVAELAAGEVLSDAQMLDASSMVVVIGGSNMTRLVRIDLGARSASALGTFPIFRGPVRVTPTRFVMSDGLGKLVAMARAGGAVQAVYTPQESMMSASVLMSGERLWQQQGGKVVAVDSDGSDLTVIDAASLIGCTYTSGTNVLFDQCDAALVIVGTSVQAYDAATGSLRVRYGDVLPLAPPLAGSYSFSPLTEWGAGGVLTELAHNPNDAGSWTIRNYFIKTNQAGIALIGPP